MDLMKVGLSYLDAVSKPEYNPTLKAVSIIFNHIVNIFLTVFSNEDFFWQDQKWLSEYESL